MYLVSQVANDKQDYRLIPEFNLYQMAHPGLKLEAPLREEYRGKIHGLFNPEDGFIYMPDHVDINDPNIQAILAHERVHKDQYERGLFDKVDCIAELEPEAYKKEAEWRMNNTRGFSWDQYDHLVDFGKKIGVCR